MKKRIQPRKSPRKSPRKHCKRCKYIIVEKGYDHALQCEKCGRFYGRIKTTKDLDYFREQVREFGVFAIEDLSWIRRTRE